MVTISSRWPASTTSKAVINFCVLATEADDRASFSCKILPFSASMTIACLPTTLGERHR